MVHPIQKWIAIFLDRLLVPEEPWKSPSYWISRAPCAAFTPNSHWPRACPSACGFSQESYGYSRQYPDLFQKNCDRKETRRKKRLESSEKSVFQSDVSLSLSLHRRSQGVSDVAVPIVSRFQLWIFHYTKDTLSTNHLAAPLSIVPQVFHGKLP